MEEDKSQIQTESYVSALARNMCLVSVTLRDSKSLTTFRLNDGTKAILLERSKKPLNGTVTPQQTFSND